MFIDSKVRSVLVVGFSVTDVTHTAVWGHDNDVKATRR